MKKYYIGEAISNIEFEDGYLFFTVIAPDGCELDGLYRIHDPENGKDNVIVSLCDGYKYSEIKEQWSQLEMVLKAVAEEQYKQIVA